MPETLSPIRRAFLLVTSVDEWVLRGQKICRVKNYKEVLIVLDGENTLGTHALLRYYNTCACVCLPTLSSPSSHAAGRLRKTNQKKPCLPGANRIYGQGLKRRLRFVC